MSLISPKTDTFCVKKFIFSKNTWSKKNQRDLSTIKDQNNFANSGTFGMFTFSSCDPHPPQVNRNIVVNQFLACFKHQILLSRALINALSRKQQFFTFQTDTQYIMYI